MIRYALVPLVLCSMSTAAAGQQVPDKPLQRWQDFYARRAFPFDQIPAGALQQARLQSLAAYGPSFAAPPPIAGSQWQPLGPEAIPINGTSIGRISTIAVHPADTNTIYIGGAQGGIWKSTDGGESWSPRTDNECSLAMGSIAIDPVTPDIVYAGTGEQHLSGDSYYGCGVLRSEDGGATWTHLGSGVFAVIGSSARIARLVIAPSTAGDPASTTILTASSHGVHRSLDGGATWTLVESGYASDIVVHPDNDSIMWAAVMQVGLFKSTNRGASWTPLGGGLPTAGFRRINLGIAHSGPDTLFAAFENPASGNLLGVWRTINGGTTWSQLTATGASCGGQCWYDLHVTVHPASADTVFFGGVSLYRSVNAGGAFANVTGSIHVDQHFLTFNPLNPRVVYAANDGGIYRSANGGLSWTSLNTGLALTQFYDGVSIHPTVETVIMGGTQDNGTLQYGGVPTWSHVLGGDGGFTAINHADPSIRYAETQWGGSFSGPRRSVNGGSYLQVTSGINLSDPAMFIPPMVMDPANAMVLYFGTNRVYRTANGGDNWVDVSGPLPGRATAIAPSASDPAVVYAATVTTGAPFDRNVFVTSDGGTTWPARNSGLPVRWIEDIAVDRVDWRTAYVVFSGFGTGHVFRTTDGGETWSDRSANLPNVPVNAVVLDPADRGIAVIGTDLGAFITTDSGGTWAPLQQGLPNVAVFDLAYNPATGVLIAATHGRGMFQLDLNRPLTLALVPGERHDTVPAGTTTPRNDSAAVVLSGAGAGTADWTASNTAAWVTVTTAAGTGGGTLRWTLNPTGLTAGTWVDTITVTVPGAYDSPLALYASLVVEGSLAVAVSPTSRLDSAVTGSPTPVPDSAAVVVSGTGHAGAGWTATSPAPWLTITTGGGTGSGTLRWRRSAATLVPGTYEAAITVTTPGAAGSPVSVTDTFVVTHAPAAFSPLAVTAQGTSGAAATVAGQAALVLAGGADSTTTWSAFHAGAAWLTIVTGAGAGSDTVRWERTAYSLLPDTWVDTITVVTSAGDTVRVEDRFTVVPPLTASACVAGHLLGVPCLDATQLRWLDLAGNADGQMNLGDFLAFRARGGGAPTVQARRP